MPYLEELQDAIANLHGGEPHFVGSSTVEEIVQGKTLWSGVVNVFELKSHPRAKHVYAWGVPKDDKDPSKGWTITTVLDGPSVSSPETAVKSVFSEKTKAKKSRSR